MQTLAQRLTQVRDRIRSAELEFNRIPGSVQLLAISKMQPPGVIHDTFELGQRDFGENYLQEALTKIQALKSLPIRWHFTGPLQSNKTRAVAEYFDWVHSIDRLKIAKRLSDQRPENFKPLNVCIQVKLEDEPDKAGINIENLTELAQQVAALPALRLRGLMAIPKRDNTAAQQRQVFAKLRAAFDILKKDDMVLDTLSAGMSQDLETAIAEGATTVRVGTAIFGPRTEQ